MKLIQEYGSTAAILIAGVVVIAWILNPQPHPLEGEMAPAFQLPLASGTTVDLAQHLGKDVVVLDFWASWCPPCRKGLPMVDAVAKHFADQPVAVYGVNIRESAALVANFVETAKLDLP
ncbi:MAG: TlpA family protein disulfide reductase, partial [Candidatus Hydrogenedentes bacterium]|nr:TlpA family protein disulfide reductase [Candidatus Hydrogenedentota bacterium]